ncbi:MAG: DUF2058 domain-containing protein [Saccharospirillaceae bacterium]|nr:DUF2058 domain-containing protein [Pseudomonadales bacterium]NRB79767.1 DUF2058 domain-containing protein [Saccharospirillaceae bacterium]
MGNSLQDQLLGLGVANKKQVNAAKKNKRIATKKKHKQGVDETLEYKALLERKRLDKIEQDRLLNQQKNEEAEKKAILAQINQLIDMNQVDIKGEEPYQFVNSGKIQKMYVSEMAQIQLANGQLVLVEFHDEVKAVGAKVADKIKQRDESKILVHNENTVPEDDDPYADFQIPDDLMW